jgi:hypothetical protein
VLFGNIFQPPEFIDKLFSAESFLVFNIFNGLGVDWGVSKAGF